MGDQQEQKEKADKYSLRARVFHHIREEILSGKYGKNEELKETALGNELGVSRTPVREALRQLELEGLVNIIPNKGAYVTGISSKDMDDIYMIRSYLEGLCANWACENITEEQVGRLEEILYLSDFYLEKGHYDKLLHLDNQFHELLYEASGSKILNHVLSDFHQYVQQIRKVILSSGNRAAGSNKEHAAILDAIREKDKQKAEFLAHEHIKNTILNMNQQGSEVLS